MRVQPRIPAIVLLTILLAVVGEIGPVARAGEISPTLERAMASAAPDDEIEAIVLMEHFPRQEQMLKSVRRMSPQARRTHVVALMRELAASSQGRVLELVRGTTGEAGMASSQFARGWPQASPGREPLDGHDHESSRSPAGLRVLWGVNGIALSAPPAVLRQIAELPEVRWVLHDERMPMEEVLDGGDVAPIAPGSSTAPFIPTHHGDGDGPTGGDASGPNPNADVAAWLTAMQVPRVWDELGYTGTGVIVAVIDNGVNRTHPDLADHIWTNLGEIPDNLLDDDQNGFVDDIWGWDFESGDNDPSGVGHGTSVAGQVAGDGARGWVTGAAPDAELMALLVGGLASEWFAASDYAIANGAHVISQSMSKKWTQQPEYEAFRRQTDTELAAGVIHVNSTGNTGLDTDKPVPYNVSVPGSCPPPWHHPDQTIVGGLSSVIGTANIDFETDVIDETSPYGPAAWEDIQANTDPTYPFVNPPDYLDYPHASGAQQGLLKPDIAAYGDGTWTVCASGGLQDSYCGFGGTSSATPHVAGVVALMLSANPDATPAELAEALLTTASHRGDPGKNNRTGVGLVQAYDAVEAVAPDVLFDAFAVDDSPVGNGDLALDPGEQVTLRVSLRNRMALPVGGVEARLRTETAGVTIHNDFARWGTIDALSSKESDAPHYTLTIDPAACTEKIVFALDLAYGGEARTLWFRARVGDEVPMVFLDDDFETDTGWTSDPGTASRGQWVREDPIGTFLGGGEPSNPEDDASDPGTIAWVTGNGDLSGPGGPDNNDVDDGEVLLLSPLFGTPAPLVSLYFEYQRWSASTQFFLDVDDYFRAEISTDGGGNWTEIESTPSQANFWLFRRLNLLLVATPTANMRLRFRMNDDGPDDTVEAAIDEVKVEGLRVDCEQHVTGPADAPNGIGDTLRAAKLSGGHLELSWQAPPVDGSHDPATLYRVERSPDVQGGFVEIGSAGATAWIDEGALTTPDPLLAYLVVAENSGGATP